MNWITDLFNQLSKVFQWWVIVMPWERGIRVRFGRKSTLLSAGTYLKLPVIDQVFIQSIRLRYMGLPIQTVTTKDRHTISLTGSVGYAIGNIERLYNSIYSPNATIANIVMGEISQFCASNYLSDCLPALIEKNAGDKLSNNDYGLDQITVKVTNYAVVKTYRLIQDHTWFPENENNLQTPSK
jgi:hypothetical protein